MGKMTDRQASSRKMERKNEYMRKKNISSIIFLDANSSSFVSSPPSAPHILPLLLLLLLPLLVLLLLPLLVLLLIPLTSPRVKIIYRWK